MALSENMKNLHEAQDVLAAKYFALYKEDIGRRFIERFGSSYQRYEEIGDNWRKIYTYSIVCETFIKENTILFLRTLPETDGIYRNPRFLKNLIAKISEFLSNYVAKQFSNPSEKRNSCTAALIEYFTTHPTLKNMMEKFQKQKELEWGLQQKARREEKRKQQKARTEKRTRIKNRKPVNPQPVLNDPKQQAKLEYKNVRERIRRKHAELVQFEISIKIAHSK